MQKRTYAGRKYAFRPEKQRLLDAVWPVLVSFSDAGTHTVGMSVSRLAREISPKDSKGKVIPELEVTVSRLSRLLAEQVRFGVLGVSEETLWDRETRQRLPRYVWITPAGWQMLGVDMVKLHEHSRNGCVKVKSASSSSGKVFCVRMKISPYMRPENAGICSAARMH